MVDQIFLSPQGKRSVIISNKLVSNLRWFPKQKNLKLKIFHFFGQGAFRIFYPSQLLL